MGGRERGPETCWRSYCLEGLTFPERAYIVLAQQRPEWFGPGSCCGSAGQHRRRRMCSTSKDTRTEMGKSRGPQEESSQHEWHCGGGWRDTVKRKNGMDGKGRTSDDMGARDRYFRFVRDARSGAHFNDTCQKGRSHGSQFDDPKGGRSWKSARRCVI